jgi:hypothetical protein
MFLDVNCVTQKCHQIARNKKRDLCIVATTNLLCAVLVFFAFETTGIKKQIVRKSRTGKYLPAFGCQLSSNERKESPKKIGEVYFCAMWVPRRTADNGS